MAAVKHLTCPKCNGDIVDPVAGNTYCCRHCQHYFEVTMSELAELTPTAPKRTYSVSEGEAPRRPNLNLRSRAETLEGIAIVLFVISVILFLAGLLCIMDGSDFAPFLFYSGAGLATGSFWLFIIAQLIHIRANTEK
ncbi:MAG TPA: hypothetical protein VGN23_07005 [Verrucomicrobiae bacterium]|jgi:hypothetical protein